jgi:hypothetical protein
MAHRAASPGARRSSHLPFSLAHLADLMHPFCPSLELDGSPEYIQALYKRRGMNARVTTRLGPVEIAFRAGSPSVVTQLFSPLASELPHRPWISTVVDLILLRGIW